MRLTAPVDGVVQQVSDSYHRWCSHPGSGFASHCPRENAVEIEAFVENKDIGFVFAGQIVTVKLETFLFTKYGTIQGKVNFVSNDAATDEKRGLIYPARIGFSNPK